MVKCMCIRVLYLLFKPICDLPMTSFYSYPFSWWPISLLISLRTLDHAIQATPSYTLPSISFISIISYLFKAYLSTQIDTQKSLFPIRLPPVSTFLVAIKAYNYYSISIPLVKTCLAVTSIDQGYPVDTIFVFWLLSTGNSSHLIADTLT